jgi:hypothetical protein
LIERSDACLLAGATWFAVTATFMIVFMEQIPCEWMRQNLLPGPAAQSNRGGRLNLAQVAFPSTAIPLRAGEWTSR